MKRASIMNVTSQDGAYLLVRLVEKGREVHGLIRRGASVDVVDFRFGRIGTADRIPSAIFSTPAMSATPAH